MFKNEIKQHNTHISKSFGLFLLKENLNYFWICFWLTLAMRASADAAEHLTPSPSTPPPSGGKSYHPSAKWWRQLEEEGMEVEMA